VPPESYHVRALSPSGEVEWYEEASSETEATPVTVAAGDHVAGIDFTFQYGEPPPPPQFTLAGSVWEDTGDSRSVSRPIPGAIVAAIPAQEAVWDSILPGGTAGDDPANTDPRWPATGIYPVFVGITDSAGVFEFPVPLGLYRLVTLAHGFRYEWWDDAERFADSDLVDATGSTAAVPPLLTIDLRPLSGDSGAVVTGFVNAVGSTVSSGDPGTPQPIQAARVSARPLVAHPWREAFEDSVYTAETGPDGAYRIALPSTMPYVVQAWADGYEIQFYDHAPDDLASTAVDVAPGAVTGNITFDLWPTPPPPDYPGVISGTVMDDPGSLDRLPAPIPGAVAAAIPEFSAHPDSSGWDPDGRPPSGTPPYPWPSVFFGFADSAGSFAIKVPYGPYRVIAFAQGYRYQWWDHAAGYADAGVYTVFENAGETPLSFHLPALPPDPFAAITGIVRGTDATQPDASLPLEAVPIEGAQVSARPLVLDPRILTFAEVVYSAETGPDGAYHVAVPADVPYVVQAGALGFEFQWYNHAYDQFSAIPVDVAPGVEAGGIDFDLFPSYVPPGSGEITGWVESLDPRRAGPGRIPVPGGVVRARPGAPGVDEIVVQADGEGRFHIGGLPLSDDGSLTYYLSAEAAGHLPAYYPGVFEWAQAQPVAPAPPGAPVVTVVPLSVQLHQGPHFAVGLVRASASPPEPGPDGTVPPDSAIGGQPAGPAGFLLPAGHDTEGYEPLAGAYLYLVSADPATDGAPGMAAGGVSAANGSVVLRDLPPGRYRAFADRPGFQKAWFHGTGPLDAAVITIGAGIEPVLIDIVLDPAYPDSVGPPVSEGASRMLGDLHNMPNPFGANQTTIVYRLAAPTDVSVTIYDIRGRRIRTLFVRVRQQAGEQRVPWNGRTDEGGLAGAGIYFFRVWTREETSTGKMVIIR
jgi:hypothetical protein